MRALFRKEILRRLGIIIIIDFIRTNIHGLATLAAIIALFFTYQQLELQTISIEQTNKALEMQASGNRIQAISSSWQLITTTALGASGKSEAIQTLINETIIPSAIVIGCGNMGGEYKSPDKNTGHKRCEIPPEIKDITLVGNEKDLTVRRWWLDGTQLINFKFDSVVLLDFKASHAEVDSLSISGSNIYNLEASGSNIDRFEIAESETDGVVLKQTHLSNGEFSGGYLNGADFTGAKFHNVNFSNISIHNWNVSGVDFCWIGRYADPAQPQNDYACTRGLSNADFLNMWAWDDQKPTGEGFSPSNLDLIKLCPSALRESYYASISEASFPWVENRGYTLPAGC